MKHLLRALSWDGTALILLDQTKLPSEIVHIRCENYRQVAEAIKILAVRGAPAIGVAAAYAVVLAFREARKTIDDPCALEAAFYESCRCIEQARPTAVNLSWAVREMEKSALIRQRRGKKNCFAGQKKSKRRISIHAAVSGRTVRLYLWEKTGFEY